MKEVRGGNGLCFRKMHAVISSRGLAMPCFYTFIIIHLTPGYLERHTLHFLHSAGVSWSDLYLFCPDLW